MDYLGTLIVLGPETECHCYLKGRLRVICYPASDRKEHDSDFSLSLYLSLYLPGNETLPSKNSYSSMLTGHYIGQ